MDTAATPYRVPPEPGRWRAFALAMLMHALLLGFLWVGISWQNVTPVAIEAEIWSPQAKMAAPPAPPAPEPEPEPPKPAPPPEPPKAVAEPEPKAKMPDPDIALEKEKKRKLALEKKLADEKARREEELEKKRLAEEEKRKQEIEKKKLAEEQEKEKRKLAELEKKKADEQKRKQEAEEKQRLAEEEKRKQEELAAEQRDKAQRERALKRLQALAGEGTHGDAEKTAAPKTNANYLGKIAGRIKLNTRFPAPDSVPGDPAFEYDLELLPDGSVKDIKIVRPSGYPAFDDAVKRAIYQTAPFPADPDTGKVPSTISFRSRLKDNLPKP